MACYRLAGGYRLYYASYNGDGAGAVPTLAVGFYLGSTGEEGIRMNIDPIYQEVKSDQLGDAVVDDVYRGQNLQMEFVVQEYTRTAVQELLFPMQTSGGATGATVDTSLFGAPGSMACGFAGTLWAFPIPGTPAATLAVGGATLTANAMQFTGMHVGPTPINLDTSGRFIPIRFRCYPFIGTGSKVRHFEWVTNSTEPSAPYTF